MKKGYEITASADAATLYVYGGIGMPDDAGYMCDPAEFSADVAAIKAPSMMVQIASIGGDPVAAGAMYQALVDHPAHVTTLVESKAYSAASLLLQAGDKRKCKPLAMIMVHGPSVALRGTAADLRNAAAILDAHIPMMTAAYLRHGIPEDTVRGWLTSNTDHFFSADDALKANLIDAIEEDVALSASAPTQYRIAAMAAQPPRKTAMADETPGAVVTAAASTPEIVARHSATVQRAEQEGVKKEAKRRGDIAAVFAQFYDADPLNPITALHNACMDDTTCDELSARRRLLDHLAAGSAHPILTPAAYVPAPAPSAPPQASRHLGGIVQAGADHLDKLGGIVTDALLVRAGLQSDPDAVRRIDASGYRGRSLLRMGEEWLRAGNRDPSRMADKDIAAALFIRASGAGPHTAGDFTGILANVATKAAMRGWTEAGSTWQLWANVGSLPDFKQATIAGLGAFPDLDQIPRAGGPYKHASMDDAYETAQLATYGKLFGISREAIINDDLGEFTRVPRAMGIAAARKVNAVAYAVLTANSYVGQTMTEDSTALFASGHSNYVASGSGAAPSTTTLNTAAAAMRKQKAPLPSGDSSAAYLNINPAYILTVPELEGTTRAFIQGQWDPAGTTASVSKRDAPNIWKDRLEIVVDPVLTLATGWWLAAAKNGPVDTVTVFFLNGNDAPYIEQTNDEISDGATFKVRIDAAARALDFRGLYFNYGA